MADHHTLRAMIYVPNGSDLRQWQARALDRVDKHGYELLGMAQDGQVTWESVTSMLTGCPTCGRDRQMEVLVVPPQRYLPVDRIPRVDYVS